MASGRVAETFRHENISNRPRPNGPEYNSVRNVNVDSGRDILRSKLQQVYLKLDSLRFFLFVPNVL